MDVRQMEVDTFGEALNDEALANELDLITATEENRNMMINLGEGPRTNGAVSEAEAEQYREDHGWKGTFQMDVAPEHAEEAKRRHKELEAKRQAA